MQVLRGRVGFSGQFKVGGDGNDIDIFPELAVQHVVIVRHRIRGPVGIVPPVGAEEDLAVIQGPDLLNGRFPIVFVLFGLDQVGGHVHPINVMLFSKLGRALQELVVLTEELVFVAGRPRRFDITEVVDDRVELNDHLVALGLQGGNIGGHFVPVGLGNRRVATVEIAKVRQQGDGDSIQAQVLGFLDDLIGVHSPRR